MIGSLLEDIEAWLPKSASREQREYQALTHLVGDEIYSAPTGVTIAAQIVELRSAVETLVAIAPLAPFDEFCVEATTTLLDILRADQR